MGSDSGYILTEIWKARPSWLALSLEERQQFFNEKIGPFLMSLVEQGAEFLACAINDNTGPGANGLSIHGRLEITRQGLSVTGSKPARRKRVSSITSSRSISVEASSRRT